MKKEIAYIEQLKLANGKVMLHSPLTIGFDKHDRVVEIIEFIRRSCSFNKLEQITQFAINLKMFSEVIIKTRNHSLFRKFFSVSDVFMEKL
jgi:hypothetical protein